jgi:hypothetical protein
MSPGKLALAVSLAVVVNATARINVVTIPDRDSVQLTIYNSVDLTMVRETRYLTFRKGLNRLEFSWANTLIDPTSVEFRALTQADKVDVLDVSFPPRVTNTLEWRINSEVAGEVQVEIRYFTSGIAWAADYVCEADRLEKAMTLAGNVRVTNNSGEDYENAQVRLVVGVIRLVEQIAQLARFKGMLRNEMEKQGGDKLLSDMRLRFADAVQEADAEGGDGGGFAGRADKPRQVVKEGLSEYFLYTVEGRDTIPTGWSKRLPSFAQKDVAITSYYKFERERYGDRVMRFYQFKNDKESKLGNEPLPDGNVMAFRTTTPDNLYAFVGRTAVKYIPVGEQVEMELGQDLEVMVKPKLMDWQKVDVRFNQDGNVDGWTIKETWEFELQNSKEIDVVLDIRRNFPGDWDLKTDAKYENVDKTKVKFVIPMKPREKQTLTYELTTRYGTNVTR